MYVTDTTTNTNVPGRAGRFGHGQFAKCKLNTIIIIIIMIIMITILIFVTMIIQVMM